MLEDNSHGPCTAINPPPVQFTCPENGANASPNKRKRRPAGTPDPDAEVISLSPKTLLESDRYVCEICNQGFQRDQNLQMHRRRHKVPWKLLKRESPVAKKRVFVCPEPSCLHHDPCHALGDLVGIKKHYRRKHSNHKQWVCEKCSKGYAVQSDYKAHLKTCGTRGHSCDCGRVFSRVESFIEHQDACNMGRLRSETQALQPACLSRTASSPSPSSDTNFSTAPWAPPPPAPACNLSMFPKPRDSLFLLNPTTLDSSPKNNLSNNNNNNNNNGRQYHNLELQLSTASNPIDVSVSIERDDNHSTQLQLSIGSSDISRSSPRDQSESKEKPTMNTSRIKEQAREQLRLAITEKAFAEDARRQARKQIELAEQEFANAKRIRQQAQGELDRALVLKDQATKQVNSTILQITCHACKQQFQARASTALPLPPPPPPPPDENSLVLSYNNNSSAGTEGEIEKNDRAKTDNVQH